MDGNQFDTLMNTLQTAGEHLEDVSGYLGELVQVQRYQGTIQFHRLMLDLAIETVGLPEKDSKRLFLESMARKIQIPPWDQEKKEEYPPGPRDVHRIDLETQRREAKTYSDAMKDPANWKPEGLGDPDIRNPKGGAGE